MRTGGFIYDFIPQQLQYTGSPDTPSAGVTYTTPLPIPAMTFLQISQSKDLPVSLREATCGELD